MRRIVRTVAAGFVVILGLALVSVAALGDNSTSPLGRPSAPDDDKVQSVPPFNPGPAPEAGIPKSLRPNVFDSEFGKRGKHKVEVRVIGGDQYAIDWRGDPETEWGTGHGAQRSRTIDSGFPVVRVAVNGAARTATCVITVDGKERDRQSSTDTTPIVVCEA
jgi:hypothetical protein